MTVLGFDCSNYTGEISPEQASALYAAGMRRAILGIEDAELFKRQFMALTGAGIECAAYVYLYNTGRGGYLAQTKVALDLIAPMEGVVRLWLDCEDVKQPWVRDIEADITDSLFLVRHSGVPVGIYTGRWWWQAYVPSFHPGPFVRLWDANYDGNPDDFSVSYGGWTYSSVKQYAGNATVAGLGTIDLDSWSD